MKRRSFPRSAAGAMPARITSTDPFKTIGEYIGSGPMRFVRDE